MTAIDQYTVRVNFTIHNATELCKIYCYSTNDPESRQLYIANTTIQSNNTPNTTNELLSTFLPIPTRTTDQMSSTHSIIDATSSTKIQPTGTIGTTGVSEVHTVITGKGDKNKNTNTSLIIALIIVLMVMVLAGVIINLMMLMLTLKKKENSKC